MTRIDEEPATFVSRATAAARLEISVDTFDQWVRDGFLPGPAINRGQIRRRHWPTIEAALAGDRDDAENDLYMRGVNRAKGTAGAPS